MERSSSNKTFLNCFRPNLPQDENTNNYHKVGSDHRTFRRFVKAVLFHTTLVNKIRRRKSKNKLYALKSTNIPSKFKQAPESAAGPPRKELNTDSNSSLNNSSFSRTSSIILSSSFSSTSWRGNLCPEYEETKEPSSRRKISSGKSEGLKFCLCFFIICLFTLTCWGEFCAVFLSRVCSCWSLVKSIDLIWWGIVMVARGRCIWKSGNRVIMKRLLDRISNNI